MKFLPKLRSFLREHNVIYTVRGYNMRLAWVYVDDVGVCRRFPLGRVHELEDLKSYVELSGFSSLKDWRAMITHFTVPGQELYLYRVEVAQGG